MKWPSTIHHVALSVTDRDRSADWYRKVLGFEELFREESAERRACVMRFAGGHYSVGLVEHSGHRDDFDARRTGLDHLAFTVETRTDLDRWALRLDRQGVEHSGVLEIPVGAILNLRDPDGIALALFWDDPDRERHRGPATPPGHSAATSDAP